MISYYIIFIIILLSLYVLAANVGYFKKIISLTIMQNAIWLFFIMGGAYHKDLKIYSNPVPNVLMLTAIVVGISTFAVAIALLMRIKREALEDEK